MKEKALIDWVESFMTRYRLFSDRAVVGLSGGADSLLLSHVLEALRDRGYFKDLLHVHIDHGLRSNSSDQAEQLRCFAKERGWNFELVSLASANINSNIEMWARQQRQLAFKEVLSKLNAQALYLGHHIDDSFEWFIRQIAGSSSSGITYGIPLINGRIRRPFHCLTKSQILNFCHLLELPIIEDQSNNNLAFQRNAISLEIKDPLLKHFPKGLAHYVQHANNWALSLNSNSKTNSSVEVKIDEDFYGLIRLENESTDINDWQGERERIVSIITKLSNKGRGELRQNLDKLIGAAMSNGARGPLNFSGGVKVFIYPGSLYFINGGTKNLKPVASDIPTGIISLKKAKEEFLKGGFLGLIVFEEKKLFGLTGLKKDELFNNAIESSQKDGFGLRPLSQLLHKASALGQSDREFKGRLI